MVHKKSLATMSPNRLTIIHKIGRYGPQNPRGQCLIAPSEVTPNDAEIIGVKAKQ